MSAVEIEQVTKSYGAHVAVSDLSLQVPENSIYGFIGPNGSGKTTTLRMIMRILHPDTGTIRVLGDDSWNSANDHVSYLPEERGLYKQMTVREILRFYADLKNYCPSRAEIDHWLERMTLQGWVDKKIEALSKGMAQKVQFIASVIAKPKLLLLDEPFSGLDPVNLEVIRETILDLRRQGTTIIFSTHDMAVAERVCDRLFMIYKGAKVLDGTLESIQDLYGSDTLRIRLEGNGFDLKTLPGVLKVTDHGKLQEVRLDRDTDTQRLLSQLMSHGKVRHFELARPSLHDIFVRIAAPTTEREESHHA